MKYTSPILHLVQLVDEASIHSGDQEHHRENIDQIAYMERTNWAVMYKRKGVANGTVDHEKGHRKMVSFLQILLSPLRQMY